MSPAIVAALAILADPIGQLASPRWAAREAATAHLVARGRRDEKVLAAVARAAMTTRDVERSWRCMRVLKTVKRCSMCAGKGWCERYGEPENCPQCRGAGTAYSLGEES